MDSNTEEAARQAGQFHPTPPRQENIQIISDLFKKEKKYFPNGSKVNKNLGTYSTWEGIKKSCTGLHF